MGSLQKEHRTNLLDLLFGKVQNNPSLGSSHHLGGSHRAKIAVDGWFFEKILEDFGILPNRNLLQGFWTCDMPKHTTTYRRNASHAPQIGPSTPSAGTITETERVLERVQAEATHAFGKKIHELGQTQHIGYSRWLKDRAEDNQRKQLK